MITYKDMGKWGGGRLGNQLFQIAAICGIAEKNGQEWAFPRWNYSQFMEREIPVLPSDFKIDESIGCSTFGYNDFILDKDLNYNISGYFQTEKYFSHISDKIHNLFKIGDGYNKLIENRHDFNNTCSVHVRRTDYTQPNDFNLLTEKDQLMKYIWSAIGAIYGDNYSDVKFMIFSDDIEWCKVNLDLPNMIFVTGYIDIIDLIMMSKCENNIIVNSSFSWWGAWLNKNPNKKVVAPSKWFRETASAWCDYERDLNDIIPDSWIKIDI